ncbi:hypothetical protein G6F68_014779 [Rhizopus microsporus]|nr:hypothetical protein G6F68_014779 [Rhizopus microsporus]
MPVQALDPMCLGVTSGRRAQARVGEPVVLSYGLAQAREHPVVQRGDVDVPVLGFEGAGRHAESLHGASGIEGLVDDRAALHRSRGFQQGDLHPRALAPHGAAVQSGARSLRRIDARRHVDQQDADLAGSAPRGPVDPHHSTHGLQRRIRSWPFGIGAVRTEGGHRDIHLIGPGFRKIGV